MRVVFLVLLLTTVAAAQPSTGPSTSTTASTDDTLKHELDELRAKQEELERRLAADEARTSTPPPDNAPLRFHFGRDGFAFGTQDGKNELRIRAVLHVDGRAYFGDVQPMADTFLVRRARPYIEATLFGIADLRLLLDFAQGQSMLLDGYVELHPWRWLRLRAGRFRVPIGLEWLQSDSTTALVERSLASDLVPQRDLGVMLNGDVADGTLCYSLALLNGAPDAGNGPDFDPQSEKDYVARIFVRPLRPIQRAGWTNLGFGVAGSYGQVNGTATATALPTYRSTGQQPIFSYITNTSTPGATTVAAGDRWRVSPQLYWYVGPVGLMAEYVLSSQSVQRMGMSADIQNRAWNLTGSFVLTLERASYDGVVPKHPIDFRHWSFGAFEIAFRYSELRIDDAAFPTFADPNTSVRSARELAGGLNWYLTENVKLMLSFHRTDYLGGAMGGDREPENALLGRLQLTM
jgi:phosphate-selective porin OprO/OprP